jgi:sulfoxide reductase catalytic subunit YedY
MPSLHVPKGWRIPENRLTPESAYLSRRELLRRMGIASVGVAGLLAGCATDSGVDPGDVPEDLDWRDIPLPDGPNAALYPATLNPRYELDRAITGEQWAATFNNYWEFMPDKNGVWKRARDFATRPWTVRIEGLVDRPGTFDPDELVAEFGMEEWTHRLRCVEAWSMAVPWAGFLFSKIVDKVGVRNEATHVELVTFLNPGAAVGQRDQPWYPWPYYEGLTMEEATNELTFIATGVYGHTLPRQMGAPWRLVVPWKYGFKSIKAMVAIRFVDRRPATFWNDVAPAEYDFEANVNPNVPHPRWPQTQERLLGTDEYVPTLLHNGYGNFVAHLYGRS